MTGPIRVLIADDQRVVREGLSMLLGLLEDVEVVGAASDGAEAVALAGRREPDVVLMDLRMPRCDGVQATRRLRAEHPDTKIVILTTYSDDRSVIDALRAGAHGYLTKDAGATEIREALRKVHDGHAMIDPAVQHHLIEAIAATPATAPAGATAGAPATAPAGASAAAPAGAPASAPPAGQPAGPGRSIADAATPSRTTGAAVPSRAAAAVPAAGLIDELTPREAEVLSLIATGLSNVEIADHLVISEGTVKSHINRLLAKLRVRNRAQAVTYAYQHGLA
jgi:DNA-binding NarL/FixJ family response regulator